MKVLLAGQAYYRRDNGQAVFTINLAEGLANASHDVMVLAPSETGRSYRWIEKGVTVQTTPAFSMMCNTNFTAFTGGLVGRVLAEFEPDIVHIQDHYFLSRSVLQMARSYNLPVVGTNHFLPANLTDNARVPAMMRGVIDRLLWWSMLSVYNRLDAVTTPTVTAVSFLRKQQIQPPVQAISCGVNHERFCPRPDLDIMAMRQKYGLAPDKALFLYVGRVDREKGLDVIVNALAQLNRNDIQFVIAGKGGYTDGLKNLCQEHRTNGVGEYAPDVVFTGFVPDDDLPLLLNSVDAFVMPSHAELQSVATLEAMSSGLPVLAANAYALPELVTPGVNGYLFSAYEIDAAARGLAALLNQRSRWAEMGQASLAKAVPHAQYRTIQAYTDWYRQILLTAKGFVPHAKLNPHPVPAAAGLARLRSDRIGEAGPIPLRPNLNHGP